MIARLVGLELTSLFLVQMAEDAVGYCFRYVEFVQAGMGDYITCRTVGGCGLTI